MTGGGSGVAVGGRGVRVGRGVLVYWRVAVGWSGIGVAVGGRGVKVLVGVRVSVAVLVAVAVAVSVGASTRSDWRPSPVACKMKPVAPAFCAENSTNTTTHASSNLAVKRILDDP